MHSYIFKDSPILAVYSDLNYDTSVESSLTGRWLSNRSACKAVPVSCDAIQILELDNSTDTVETLIMVGTDRCEVGYCSLWLVIEKKIFDDGSNSSYVTTISYLRPAKVPITIMNERDDGFARIHITRENGKSGVYKYKINKEGVGRYN